MNFYSILENIRYKTLSNEEICIIIDNNPTLAIEENYSYLDHKAPDELPINLAFAATEEGNIIVLDCLIRNGAEINKNFFWHRSPLHQAAANLNLEMVKFLLSKEADPTLKSPKGKTVLFSASTGYGNGILSATNTEEKQLQQLEIVKLLLELDSSEIEDNHTEILHAAASCGNVRLIEYYLSLGVNIDGKDSEGLTPIAQAAYEGNYEAFTYLKEKGASLSVSTNKGLTLAHLAARGNNPKIFQEIIFAKIDVNSPDNLNKLPIHYLLSSGFTEAKNVAEILNFNALDPFPYLLGDYVDPLELAVERESISCREFKGLINIIKAYQANYPSSNIIIEDYITGDPIAIKGAAEGFAIEEM